MLIFFARTLNTLCDYVYKAVADINSVIVEDFLKLFEHPCQVLYDVVLVWLALAIRVDLYAKDLLQVQVVILA